MGYEAHTYTYFVSKLFAYAFTASAYMMYRPVPVVDIPFSAFVNLDQRHAATSGEEKRYLIIGGLEAILRHTWWLI